MTPYISTERFLEKYINSHDDWLLPFNLTVFKNNFHLRNYKTYVGNYTRKDLL